MRKYNKRRLARCLRRGKSYMEVNALTGATTATISRVSRCVNYGSNGYTLVPDRLREETEDDR